MIFNLTRLSSDLLNTYGEKLPTILFFYLEYVYFLLAIVYSMSLK